MKIKQFAAFVLLLIVMLTGASGFLNNVYVKQNNTIPGRYQSMVGIQKEKKDSIDVLVIGDSESFTSFSPMTIWEQTGISSYVCGQASQQITESYFMLKEALKQQSPRLLVFETNLFFRKLDGKKALQDIFSETGKYYFSIFRYHNAWKEFVEEKKMSDTQYFKGFSIRDGVASYEGGTYMKETDEKKEISAVIKSNFEKILDLCKENNIQVLLYSAPSPVNYSFKKHNALEEYAKEKDLPYIDLNLKTKELGIDWKKDSLDKGDHLNISGAEKVSKYMSKYLQDNYDLPNRRGSEEYKEWDKSEQQFCELVGKKKDEILSK
jgi:hypothetical protein